MRAAMMLLACALVALVCWSQTPSQAATASHAAWIGVWQAKVEDRPGITLTLADDGRELAGTIVFEVLNREENRHIAHEPHTQLNANVEENVLSFQVNGCCNNGGILNMTIKQTKDGKAQFRCSNCGSEEVTELEKIQ
jgi:hypothetical protein